MNERSTQYATVALLLLLLGCGEDREGYLERCAFEDGSTDAQANCAPGLQCTGWYCSKPCQTDDECVHPTKETQCLQRLDVFSGRYEGTCYPLAPPSWSQGEQ